MDKKRHLSNIILRRTLITLFISFSVMVAASIAAAFFYAEGCMEDFVRFCLDNTEMLMNDKSEYNMKKTIEMRAGECDRRFRVANEDRAYLEDSKASDFFRELVDTNTASEIGIFNSEGIIVSSSEPLNIGYDLNSGKDSAKLLSVLKGGETVMTDMIRLRNGEGSEMRYIATFLPAYGGGYFEGADEENYAEYEEIAYYYQVQYSNLEIEGYYLYADSSNNIISSFNEEHNGEKLKLPGNESLKKLSETGDVITAEIFGVGSYVGVLPVLDKYLVAVYPLYEAWEVWTSSFIALIGIYMAAFFILLILIRYLMNKYVVKEVYGLNDTLNRITKGNLNEKADFRGSAEFSQLSDGINITVDRLKTLIKEAEGRIDADMKLAAKIQYAFLPHAFPVFPDRKEFELYASMVPAKDVGGDFYDFYLLDSDHLALVIADVSGRGLPASLFMAASKDKIRYSLLKNGTDVAKALEEVNKEMVKENNAMLFLSVWAGVLTISTGHMDYVNAGHDHPAICHRNGQFRIVKGVHSVPVAALTDAEFKSGTMEIEEGDILCLYTDGIYEARNSSNEMFGMDRMTEKLDGLRDEAAEDIDAGIRAALKDFVKDEPQSDDSTMLVFRYRGSGNG